MKPYDSKCYIVVVSVCLLAMLLSILPMPGLLWWFKPSWLLLVMVFFTLQFPGLLSLFSVWCMGLFCDLLLNDVFGLHALIFVLVFWLATLMSRFIKSVVLLQQLIVIFGFSLLQLFCVALANHWQGSRYHVGFLLLVAVLNSALWPAVVMLLSRFKLQKVML